ncbi:uncharacterized protein N7443_008070 [Penicillium atrosanguineum]|uniref:uncharacterized protein n=1 Tax=Penicillium atrosanguineum TaxID=1132637 RepID=UPI0023A36AFD|nr:uncharacterized protein N7443_008070 [Penicillium atrosanguineum]KAJ5297177.1 hypothetical protein N7443_008070 [Penicillium atrosanguineum]
MDFDSRLSGKRESRTRAPTACQTCRLRKTRCDNVRPICSYCTLQEVVCIYPEASPRAAPPSLKSANSEILQRLSHITSMLEDIKQDNESITSSNRSIRGSCVEVAMPHSSPHADSVQGKHTLRGNDAKEQAYRHDPLTLYAANSPEYMLRWPIFNRVVTDAEKHIRSFLLDSLDSQAQSRIPPLRQASTGSFLDNIQMFVRKYLHLVHRRNPVVDAEQLERYAREVTVQGLGWDGPSCQVLLACALGCCTSDYVPHDNPEDLDRLQKPPLCDASIEIAEAYFHAAKQRLGSLHTSPIDIQCFLLAGFYHRHAMRPLQAWFCFQQASCRLEVRLRSLCREQWTADVHYHNLESRLYWSCIQAEHEMQSELPLWSSGLESLGYADPFPKFPKTSSNSLDEIVDDETSTKPPPEINGTDEEKGWRFYIGSICNRRTVNDMLEDMWRSGEQAWITNITSIVEKTSQAESVVFNWYHMSTAGLPNPEQKNQDLESLMLGRLYFCLEKIYRPIFYLALHYPSLPSYLQNDENFSTIFDQAQKALDNCVRLIPRLWYNWRHEWIWNCMRITFSAAIQIMAAVLSKMQSARNPSRWTLNLPYNWPALVRLSIRTLVLWERESIDLEIMRSTLERMYQGTCRLAGVRPELYSL